MQNQLYINYEILSSAYKNGLTMDTFNAIYYIGSNGTYFRMSIDSILEGYTIYEDILIEFQNYEDMIAFKLKYIQ